MQGGTRGQEQGLLSEPDLGMNLYGEYSVDFKTQLGYAK